LGRVDVVVMFNSMRKVILSPVIRN
jgi:hypothetical protein